MKKAQVDATIQDASLTDSSLNAREGASSSSRRKGVLPTETCGTRAEEADESSIGKKAPQKKVASKKTGKSRSKPVDEQVDSESVANVGSVAQDDNLPKNADDDANCADFQNAQVTVPDPFPNELQFNAPETETSDDVSCDVQPSSDRFFCSDEQFEKFFHDKFSSELDDDFDDDFDEDFIQLDDIEFNETLDDGYDEGDDTFEYSDDDIDSDSDSSDEDEFDNLDSDEDIIDADEDYPTL